MRHIPAVEFYRTDRILYDRSFDLVILHSQTEYFEDLERSLDLFATSLNPRGQIWFTHNNFYGCGGHKQAPKTISDFDPNNPLHLLYADWAHITFEPPPGHPLRGRFNRVIPARLREIVEDRFNILRWDVVMEKEAVAKRLTDSVASQIGDLPRNDLLTKQIVCHAKRL